MLALIVAEEQKAPAQGFVLGSTIAAGSSCTKHRKYQLKNTAKYSILGKWMVKNAGIYTIFGPFRKGWRHETL